MDDRRVTSEQVEEIISRALELEATTPMLAQDELLEIARGINLSPQALEQATAEVLADSESPTTPTTGWSKVTRGLEFFAALEGGLFTGIMAGLGFPIPAVALVLLGLVGLASRRDWPTIATLMAQWIVLCGMFGFVASLFSFAIPPASLGALFAGGGIMAAAIVWLQERSLGTRPEGDQPLLPKSSPE